MRFLHVVGLLALLSQRQTEIVHRQPGVDRENPQRFAASVKILVPLEHWNGEHVQGVEVELFVLDDNFPFAADNKINFVIEMTMRAGRLPGGISAMTTPRALL